jgi:hypothetical protein
MPQQRNRFSSAAAQAPKIRALVPALGKRALPPAYSPMLLALDTAVEVRLSVACPIRSCGRHSTLPQAGVKPQAQRPNCSSFKTVPSQFNNLPTAENHLVRHILSHRRHRATPPPVPGPSHRPPLPRNPPTRPPPRHPKPHAFILGRTTSTSIITPRPSPRHETHPGQPTHTRENTQFKHLKRG